MATVVPAVPTFADNDHSITNLNNLSSCVRFLVGDLRPQWHAFKTSNSAAMSSKTWTTIGFANTAYDSEASGAGTTGILSAGTGLATIRTQGIYSVESCMTCIATSTAFEFQSSFLLTGGASNPNLGSGSTLRFGLRGDITIASAGSQVTLCCADSTPICCYPGDTITPQAWAGVASIVVTYNNNQGSSGADYRYGRFSSNFTGRWARAGV